MRVKRLVLVGICALVFIVTGVSQLWASTEASGVSPDEAMSMLREGNARYVSGTSKHPNEDQERRTLTSSKGQHPFATILSCSDSRVPPEVLFDAGIGDLFIIRVAGNVVDTDEAGSIEYGVDHLATPVLVVMGHTRCGAVTAVVQKAALHGNIPRLVNNIKPAVDNARKKDPSLTGDAFIEEAVKANVWQAIDDLLRTSEATREKVKSGGVKVAGAVYDIETGKVSWLGPHPDQEKLMAQYGKGHTKEGKSHQKKK